MSATGNARAMRKPRLCARCHSDRAAHKEGAPGSCSKFINVLPCGHRGGKPRRVPTGIERAYGDLKGEE